MKNVIWFCSILAMVSLLIINACDSSDDSNGKANVNFKLTDAPGEYESVNVDVQDVNIHYVSDSETIEDGWVKLDNVYAGIYNLLDFRDGKDTLIAGSELEAKKITQVRLVLGNNNSVVADGATYPLTIPSGSHSGLKIKINEELKADSKYIISLDFDAEKSVHKTGNDTYMLKPVITAKLQKL